MSCGVRRPKSDVSATSGVRSPAVGVTAAHCASHEIGESRSCRDAPGSVVERVDDQQQRVDVGRASGRVGIGGVRARRKSAKREVDAPSARSSQRRTSCPTARRRSCRARESAPRRGAGASLRSRSCSRSCAAEPALDRKSQRGELARRARRPPARTATRAPVSRPSSTSAVSALVEPSLASAASHSVPIGEPGARRPAERRAAAARVVRVAQPDVNRIGQQPRHRWPARPRRVDALRRGTRPADRRRRAVVWSRVLRR